FFPDVGAGYFLNKMPGYTGVFLALTGEMINGMEILYANAADYLIPANKIEECMKEIMEKTDYDNDTVDEQLKEIFNSYKCDYKNSILEENNKLINQHFGYVTIEEIIHSLKTDKSEFAQKYYQLLLEKSPVS